MSTLPASVVNAESICWRESLFLRGKLVGDERFIPRSCRLRTRGQRDGTRADER